MQDLESTCSPCLELRSFHRTASIVAMSPAHAQQAAGRQSNRWQMVAADWGNLLCQAPGMERAEI